MTQPSKKNAGDRSISAKPKTATRPESKKSMSVPSTARSSSKKSPSRSSAMTNGRAGSSLSGSWLNPWRKAQQRLGKRTDLERLMARALTDNNTTYVEQKWVGPYCVDFYLPGFHAVVEVDGTYWHKSRKDKDDRKDKYLRACGFHVFRFDEWAVKQNANACVTTVIRNVPLR